MIKKAVRLLALVLCLSLPCISGFAQTTTENYIQVLAPKNGYTPADVNTHKDDFSKVTNTIQYFDGLGRLVQVVERAVTPAGKDLVTFYSYDNFGRKTRDYLPYEDTSTDPLGSFRPRSAALSRQEYFYEALKQDYAAYHEVIHELSPLNRILKRGSPGLDWEARYGNDVDYAFRANTSTENVRIWTISGGRPVSSSAYGANQLYLKSIEDEDKKIVLEYTDKQGRVVLKKVQATDAPSEAHDGWACTYYVYDDLNNLRFVIPPEAVKLMDGNWSKAANEQSFFNEFLFAYSYDKRRRMIEKKVPGADWVLMVYDKRDRLVLVQDGNQRGVEAETLSSDISLSSYQNKSYMLTSTGSVTLLAGFEVNAAATGEFFVSTIGSSADGSWIFTKYDELNRPVMTGKASLTGSRDFDTRSEKFTGSGPLEGYTNNAFPQSGITSSNLLSVTYYDHYNFSYFRFEDNLRLGYTADSRISIAQGQVTGTMVKSLPDGTWLRSVSYYDAKKRLITSVSQNHLGGKEVVATKYHFDGRIEATERLHNKQSDNTVVKEIYSYDNAGRITNVAHGVNTGTTASPATSSLAANTYNAIGELTQKSLKGNIQTVNYQFNIRGWLTKINDGGTVLNGSDKFGLELLYNNANTSLGNQKMFNGNISAMIWRNHEDGTEGKAYTYTYDKMNRLATANYHQRSGTSWDNTTGMFSVSVDEYDLNGNIRKLRREGSLNGVKATIDNLSYTYENGGQSNRLARVTDAGDDFYGFKDGSNTDDDYVYDRNGNLIVDHNKEITSISYNHLNLPERITFGSGKYVQYTYDAAGTKVTKQVYNGSTSVYTDYIQGIQYEGGVLQFIATAEGRWKPNGVGYEFDLKDHLGNVRVTIDQSGTVIQSQDYYPFGMTFGHPNVAGANKYLYNGKELQQDLGLEWYDYGARFYDAAIGRWHAVDPLADQFPEWSPYVAFKNNPIYFVDPDGRAAVDHIDVTENDDGTYTVVGGEANSDKNIYVVDGGGNRTGEVVGEMLTEYSFHGNDGNAVVGAVIDPNDNSGQDFMDNEIIGDNPGLVDYMENATGGKKYDFKTRDMPNGLTPEARTRYSYRGMKYNGKFASGRDIGNAGAGYMAGRNGLSWGAARAGFDTLESYQQGELATEGQPSQRAQRVGFNAGSAVFQKIKAQREWEKATNPWPTNSKW